MYRVLVKSLLNFIWLAVGDSASASSPQHDTEDAPAHVQYWLPGFPAHQLRLLLGVWQWH